MNEVEISDEDYAYIDAILPKMRFEIRTHSDFINWLITEFDKTGNGGIIPEFIENKKRRYEDADMIKLLIDLAIERGELPDRNSVCRS